MFIGREEEIATLHKQLGGSMKSAILLYGRRRIGKTALIKEVLNGIDDCTIIYHEFHQVTTEQNLAAFSKSIASALSLPSLPSFTSLTDAFAFITQLNRKAIVIMDEYSDLKTNSRKGEIDSYMRTVIDNMGDNVSLVVMGSLLKIMEELLEAENPLFGRFTTIMKLEPLDYLTAARFFPGKSRYEQLEIYSVFGGSPYVLSLLDAEEDLKESIKQHIIPLSGSIRAYCEAVINQEAARLPHGIAILSLLGNGKKRYLELEDVIGSSASGVLDKELKKLIELELVTRTQPINKSGKTRCFYELSDSLLRFYFTYIYSNPALLMTNAESFYGNFIERSIKDFIARRFEAVCRQYFISLVRSGERNDITRIGTYWYDDRNTHTNGEFDIALETMDGYEIYDAKFLTAPFSEAEAEKEARQIKALNLSISRWGIISTAGFEKKSEDYIQLSMKDLFKMPQEE